MELIGPYLAACVLLVAAGVAKALRPADTARAVAGTLALPPTPVRRAVRTGAAARGRARRRRPPPAGPDHGRAGRGLLPGLRRLRRGSLGPGRAACQLRLLRHPGHPGDTAPCGRGPLPGRVGCGGGRHRRVRHAAPSPLGPAVARRAPGPAQPALRLAGRHGPRVASPELDAARRQLGITRGRRREHHPRRTAPRPSSSRGSPGAASSTARPSSAARWPSAPVSTSCSSRAPPTATSAPAATAPAGAARPAAPGSPSSAARSTAATTTARPTR